MEVVVVIGVWGPMGSVWHWHWHLALWRRFRIQGRIQPLMRDLLGVCTARDATE